MTATITSGLAFHFFLQPEPDPVQPDGNVVLLDLKSRCQFFDRQPFHVTQQEETRVVGVEGGDGAPELLFEQHGPVDRGMRGAIVVGRLGVDRSTAQNVDRSVHRRPPEVGGRPIGRAV